MANKSNKEIFSEIYSNSLWHKMPGEKFGSGSGSHDEKIIVPYINLLIPLIVNNNIQRITDLGCGDFWIMRHVLGFLAEKNYNFFYNGVDVVEDLINYNRETFRHPNIKFHCMDAAQDDSELPFGELLIIRQVLQHLSNDDVKIILDKAKNFKFVLVTESIYDGADAVHNINFSASYSTRGDFKSGVYVEYPPYNFKNVVHLLKIQGKNGAGDVIRSSLIINDVTL
ncbi:MAG: class I SAM-dependent methyltransferase [Selenomonadaceae bacterium]|nr:class I SAM-dependent methyltransferase [Selenomonadaceae bacterium]